MTNFYPSFRYKDPRAAIDWLEKAFGFERTAVHDAPDGSVAHAEMKLGDGVFMFGEDKPDRWGERSGLGWCYVGGEDLDIDALHASAVAAGAKIEMPPTDQDYGSRDFSARDLEGNLWSFGTYAP
jgi:uncharacterized glyoxalase superfamily protein PhnB